MNKRSRVWAILAAGILTLGVAGIALAEDLLDGQVGITLSEKFDEEACADFPLEIGEGQVGLHFVLTQPESDEALLDANFSNPVSSINDVPDADSPAASLHFYAVITGTGATVLEGASTDIDGGNLVLSHACANGEEETPPPSFEESQEGETDAPSDVPSEAPSDAPSDVPSDVPSEAPSDEPSFEQSQEGETDAPSDVPSFEQSQEGETDAPTEPNTAAIGGNGTSAPADGAWLLVVALGVLLASIVVLSPARAKGTR